VSDAGASLDQGRIVVVAAGFALWRDGRCGAAGRWADIRRMLAYRRPPPAAATVALAVELRDGTMLELREEAPGYDAFLDRASATLSGLRPYKEWHPGLTEPSAPGDGVVLFDRSALRY
jgi:hypothetical protein